MPPYMTYKQKTPNGIITWTMFTCVRPDGGEIIMVSRTPGSRYGATQGSQYGANVNRWQGNLSDETLRRFGILEWIERKALPPAATNASLSTARKRLRAINEELDFIYSTFPELKREDGV